MRRSSALSAAGIALAVSVISYPLQASESSIKPISKLLICGVNGGGYISIGSGKDSHQALFINGWKVLNKAYDELVSQFSSAGIGVVGAEAAKEAAAEVQKNQRGQRQASFNSAGAKAGQQIQAMQANSQGAMLQPKLSPEALAQLDKLPPEARAAYEKQMAARGGAAGANPQAVMQNMMESSGKSIAQREDREEAESMKHPEEDVITGVKTNYVAAVSDQSQKIAGLCKNASKSRGSPEDKGFYEALDKMGADGFAIFGLKIDYGKGKGNIGFDVSYFDKNGKQLFNDSKHYGTGQPETPRQALEDLYAKVHAIAAKTTEQLYK